MEYLGLFFEIAFLVMALYIYLFAIGRVTTKDPKLKDKAEEFRKNNGWWMRMGALAIMAIMLINVYIHVMQMLK